MMHKIRSGGGFTMEKRGCYAGDPPLLHKILLLLPEVSLLRCKFVCKSWRDLIESSFFIDLRTTATTLNSSSSSSSSKFGSLIIHTVNLSGEGALFMLSSVSEESVFRSVSGRSCREDDDDRMVFQVDDQLVVKLNLGFPSHDKVSPIPVFRGRLFTNPISHSPFSMAPEDDNFPPAPMSPEDDNFPPAPMSPEDDDAPMFPEDYNFPPPPISPENYNIGSGTIIVGSCNGLVCLRSGYSLSLWNPAATGQFKILPEPINIGRYCLPILGFDVETKDYRVLLLTQPTARWNGHGPTDCFFKVQVYSLSTDSWRLLEGITCLPGNPFYYRSITNSGGLYLNGSCFLLVHFFYTRQQPCLAENDRFIISFDFTKEIITPIQLPDHHRNQELHLCYFGDKIALFTAPCFIVPNDFRSHNDTRIGGYEDFNIWVLNEYGSSSNGVTKESWEKLHSFQIEIKTPYESYIPRGISNDGKFALLETRYEWDTKMNLYSLVTKEMKNLLSGFLGLSKAHAYKPSLVSIIGGNGTAAADMVIGNGDMVIGNGAAAAAADMVIGNGATNL